MKIPDDVLAKAFQIYLDQRWPCKESFAKAIEYAMEAMAGPPAYRTLYDQAYRRGEKNPLFVLLDEQEKPKARRAKKNT